MKEIYITAHAGAERTKPNTMESLEKMINLPCQMVEVDVRKCDGKLVLSHDPLKQQESVTGFVKLSEALEVICKNKKGVNLDLKEEILPEVFEELKNCLVSKKVVFSGSIRIADIEMHPEIAGKVILNYENLYENSKEIKENLKEAAVRCKELGVYGINLEYTLVDRQVVEYFARQDVKVFVWTVDGLADMERMLENQVDGITTNEVWRLHETIRRNNHEQA